MFPEKTQQFNCNLMNLDFKKTSPVPAKGTLFILSDKEV